MGTMKHRTEECARGAVADIMNIIPLDIKPELALTMPDTMPETCSAHEKHCAKTRKVPVSLEIIWSDSVTHTAQKVTET